MEIAGWGSLTPDDPEKAEPKKPDLCRICVVILLALIGAGEIAPIV